ncbi:MAG: response regulator transcription factor [Oscillospiraceae bacterium]|jgi:DNA-binding NarL/FixJ family response regulator|nr:response regulator transcription factor [Oscillospiraceae bacterium]
MNLLVVDDDGLIRDSLKLLLETEEGWFARTAPDGAEAFRLCGESQPDVVLMDIRMPGCDGVAATKMIKNAYPGVKIVMLTTFTDNAYIASAIEAGAEGYLLKSTPADGIVERIRAVEKGAMVFDRGVGLSAKKTAAPSFERLTERENEVLSLVAAGLSNGEIAAKLFLSQGTVRNAVSVILEKLELRDRTQLAVYYWKQMQC